MAMRGLSLLLAVSALLTVFLAGPAAGQNAGEANGDAKARIDALLTAAQKFYDGGEYAAAREKLAELLKLAPAHPEAVRLATNVDAVLERERFSLYRRAAFEEEAHGSV